MTAPIRFALLGTGGAAGLHADALGRIPDAELVAVAGRRRDRTEAFAAKYGARAAEDLEALLGAGADVLVVATPHPLHADAAVAGAGAGLHVVVEKPMALTTDECDRMIEAARQAGVTLSVVAQRRWYPAVRRVHHASTTGRIGEPALGILHVLGWRSAEYYAADAWRGTAEGEGGGVLVNQAVHGLDLLRWLLGPPAEVDGHVANINHPEIEVEDTALALVRFASGALASIVASNSQRPGLYTRLHVHGSSGASVGVETDRGSSFVAGASLPSPARNDLWTIPGEEDGPEAWREEDERALSDVDAASHFHEMQLRDVVAAIRQGRAPSVTGDDGRAAVELMMAIYAAASQGERVRLAQPPSAS